MDSASPSQGEKQIQIIVIECALDAYCSFPCPSNAPWTPLCLTVTRDFRLLSKTEMCVRVRLIRNKIDRKVKALPKTEQRYGK